MGTTDSFREFEHAGWSNGGVCSDYDKHFGAITIQSVPALLDAARVVEGARVLDVCCGAGYAAGLAAERGADALGVDFSQAQVDLASARYPNVAFRQGDATSLGFDGQNFDCVVNGIGIPHFQNPDAALVEAFRVLRRRGRFAFSVYAQPEQAVGFGLIYGAVQAHGTMDIGLPPGPNFFLFSDAAESERRLTAAGFQGVEFSTVAQTWRLSSAEELFAAVMNGSVRAAATLRAQDEDAFERIKSTVESNLTNYRTGQDYQIPMPVVIASATKP
jgi:ubiquinone/menaquinone biosynthesis C-methylase UbiE